MATIKDNAKILEILTSLSKQRGFVFQSSEIYGGLGSTWDYGPLGAVSYTHLTLPTTPYV